MKQKKAMEGITWTLIVFVLLLLFLFIYSGMWTKLFGKGVKSIDNSIGATTSDHDNDGIADFADKCPCVSGDNEYSGCTRQNPEDTEKNDRNCLK